MSNEGNAPQLVITGDEEQAPNAAEADTQALANAHYTCADLAASDEEVLDALDTLLSSVEAEESLPNQVDTAVAIAAERGLISTPELASRIAAHSELQGIAASLRTAGLDLLVDLACSENAQVAKVARQTLSRGPLVVDDQDRWATAVSLIAGEDNPNADDVLDTVEMLFS